MKKKATILIISVFVVGLTMNSCKKIGCTNELATNYDADAEKEEDSCEFGDTTRPVITIQDPSKAMYMLDTAAGFVNIPVIINVADDQELHSVMVVLQNTTEDTEALHIHLQPDEAEALVDTFYTVTMGHKDYTLTVTAEDHDENVSTEEFETHVHMM